MSFTPPARHASAEDSPHLLLSTMTAALPVCYAEHFQAGSAWVVLRTAERAGRRAEVEIYPADSGWCTPDSPAYDPSLAEWAWARLRTGPRDTRVICTGIASGARPGGR
ncbi:MAG: hypothetical protein ABMA64_21700, partial [Myxococcota bacterium]